MVAYAGDVMFVDELKFALGAVISMWVVKCIYQGAVDMGNQRGKVGAVFEKNGSAACCLDQTFGCDAAYAGNVLQGDEAL